MRVARVVETVVGDGKIHFAIRSYCAARVEPIALVVVRFNRPGKGRAIIVGSYDKRVACIEPDINVSAVG